MHGQDDHARQRRHAADEVPELVIISQHPDRNGALGVKIPGLLSQRLEQLDIDTRGQRSLRDVHQQLVHLGLARQLAEHRFQKLSHLFQLGFIRLEVGGLLLLVLKITAQAEFLLLYALEFIPFVTDQQEITTYQQNDEQQDEQGISDGGRGAAQVRVINVSEITKHYSPPC